MLSVVLAKESVKLAQVNVVGNTCGSITCIVDDSVRACVKLIALALVRVCGNDLNVDGHGHSVPVS